MLWHLYSQKLGIINLLGEREQERNFLSMLDMLSRQIDDPCLKIDLMLMNIRYLCDVGDLPAAESLIEALFETIADTDDKHVLRKAFEWRALIYREMTRLPLALRDYEEAEKLSDNDITLAGVWLDKGLALSYANRLAESEALLKKTITVYERFNSVDVLGDANNNLGICLAKQARLEEALTAYSTALKYYEKIGYKLGSAIVSGNIAEIYWHLGDFDRGYRSAENCVAIGSEAEDPISMCLGYEMLGRLNMDVGCYKKAIPLFEKSIESIKDVNDLVIESQEHGYLAICLSRAGNVPAAEAQMEKAENIARNAGDDAIVKLLFHFKILMYESVKGNKDVLAMIDHFLARAESKLYKNNHVTLLGLKASLLIAQGELAEAKECFENIHKYIEGATYHLLLLDYNNTGFNLYRELKEKEPADRHYNEARRLFNVISGNIADEEPRKSFMGLGKFKILASEIDRQIK
jgi:tetratricopeptide (TPR) repeat protein